MKIIKSLFKKHPVATTALGIVPLAFIAGALMFSGEDEKPAEYVDTDSTFSTESMEVVFLTKKNAYHEIIVKSKSEDFVTHQLKSQCLEFKPDIAVGKKYEVLVETRRTFRPDKPTKIEKLLHVDQAYQTFCNLNKDDYAKKQALIDFEKKFPGKTLPYRHMGKSDFVYYNIDYVSAYRGDSAKVEITSHNNSSHNFIIEFNGNCPELTSNAEVGNDYKLLTKHFDQYDENGVKESMISIDENHVHEIICQEKKKSEPVAEPIPEQTPESLPESQENKESSDGSVSEPNGDNQQ